MQDRKRIYAVLIASAAVVSAVRIVLTPGPFSENDRSRWLTVAALLERGSYSIGELVVEGPGQYKSVSYGSAWALPQLSGPNSDTIDKVLLPDSNKFISDKPPLFCTVVAGAFWLFRRWFTLGEHAALVSTLFLFNWLPLLADLLLVAALVERFGSTDWGRVYVMAAACLGTFLPTFATSLTEHTVTAFCALVALYFFIRLHDDAVPGPGHFMLTGFFAAAAFCSELPAAVLLIVLGPLVLRRFPLQGMRYFIPAACVPIFLYVLTYYLATGQVVLHYHQEWLRYPGSYWDDPQLLDKGEESLVVYAFNYLFGHHGVLSLTPIFLLSWLGLRPPRRLGLVAAAVAVLAFLAALLRPYLYEHIGFPTWYVPLLPIGLFCVVAAAVHAVRWGDGPMTLEKLVPALFVVSLCVTLFWLITVRNYGGSASGPRHMLWLTPLWLLAMIPVSDQFTATRLGKFLAGALLTISAFSAFYPGINPWVDPWTYS